MQKNNCKLKTIFKKGLSFSIALALGAAATSLNLAKTAEATVDTTGARTVYLAGENAEFTTSGWTNKPTHYSTDDGTTWIAVATPVKLTSDMTKLKIASSSSGTDATDYTFTVYDWAKIYDASKTLKVSHNDGTVKAEVLDVLSFRDLKSGKETEHAAALRTLLESGVITIDGANIAKTDKFDYTAHNGKEASVKVGDVVCKLGKLEVTRAITGVELVSGPTENCYFAGEKINLDGLSLKVTYGVGDPAVVKWTKDTAGEFTFSAPSVKQDEEMAATIADITVTYGEKTTEETFTLYVVSTVSSVDNGIAKIQGTFEKTPTVNAIALSEDSEKYTKLKSAFAENAQVIFAYDILADYEASVGKMRVALNVGKNYAGQVVTVKHLANDEIETFVNKVDEDGNVTVSVDSLSPFIVVLGATEEDKAAAAETEQKNAEEAAKTEAAKTEAAKSAAASKSASSSVKTGDASVVAFSVFGFVALISAAVLAFMKKNRKNFEK